MQGDMELVGVADLAPTLAIQALREREMIGANGVKYDLYLVDGADKAQFEGLDIPVAGSFEELIGKVDIMLDSAPRRGRGPRTRCCTRRWGARRCSRAGRRTR